MARVEFFQVCKNFNAGNVVDQFSLEVEKGECVALVGPQGSGKSTLLRMLAGLETASSGEILIDGNSVNEQTARQHNIAMVFQNYALYPDMSVRGNLQFPLKMMKLNKLEMEWRVKEAENTLNLREIMAFKPRQLTTEECQRVAMARAMVRYPQLLLLDEPLRNLNAKLRSGIRTEVAALQRRLGATTIYASEDYAEAMTLANRIAVIEAGRLQQVSTPQMLYERPANLFVAGFIGTPKINLFESHVNARHNKISVDFGNQRVIVNAYSPRLQARLLPYVMGMVWLGIRPEAFSLSNSEVGDVEVRVDAVEPLGHETLIHFHLPSTTSQATLIARLPGDCRVRSKEKVWLAIDKQRILFFSEHGIRVG
ncbi:MAG: ABC transporter ATP-binding protein [Gammaproteobacteria bacterium]|nr:ABC transporter ATP-binding protein [Gammaproteobacteria bacterium]